MSYCRWSCDDFQCDVYCYDGEEGFFVCVAGTRPVFREPLPPAVPFDAAHMEEWLGRYNAVLDMVGRADRKPIGLPHDGDVFVEPDASSAADRLQSLKDIGYNVPQYAIDNLRAESEEEA